MFVIRDWLGMKSASSTLYLAPKPLQYCLKSGLFYVPFGSLKKS